MNFRTVRVIRNGLRRGESGQAFAELTVSLVAILAVFVGFLLIAALCSDRVTMLITAREEADRKSSNGVSSQEGESIQSWDYGADRIPYTTDDTPIPGSGGNGALFKDQLKSADIVSGTVLVSLMDTPGSLPELNSDFTMLQDNDIFVNAASLTSGDAGTTNSLQNHNIGSLENAIKWLFGVRSTHVEDTVYMPAHKDPTSERED